ncbi:glycolipid 2-alpha-mannosyltransferase-domain-containing protein [Pseudomassariella vexata]|uniref:Glycolipid 2-alpha-mannosyltransferase-domain-containing protein n=1 Tax=Pseudomassariella vexata TaxID=1141098 RepID=A0A1Y2DGM1_9PEZI|nr:glycolipid 2-alpha-mannosyltransferase-domain-containing protein [Pseudomassariella vexata]ORY58431.1 glycolipid 2-alpha-mannosyltransferase-domain-containing protein [Pseudomassariella vexata]
MTPREWLRENTHIDHSYLPTIQQLQALGSTRPKAAFITLVRNSEFEGMVYSMTQLEARFNGRNLHGYDWIFFNNEEFTEEFKSFVSNTTSARCYFETIPEKHWSIPDWIDESRFDAGRQFIGGIGVGKAWLESYHHMYRWNAGLFALEDRLKNYDWFWRVEPGVKFTCDINYDVFRFMQDNDMVYGFNMVILDDARSFPSLWERTSKFRKYHRDMLHPESDMTWLLHPRQDGLVRSPQYESTRDSDDEGEYNNCQFYSNFEIGSLKYFRGKEHQAYFRHLDQAGGFYYERYGDAPVHTLSISMFVPKRRVWYFRNIGYAHSICENCPPHTSSLTRDIERQRGIPGLRCGCTTNNFDINHFKLVPFESKQRKPLDTCIRQWLGGRWLQKQPDHEHDMVHILAESDDDVYFLDGTEPDPYSVPMPRDKVLRKALLRIGG